MKMHRLGAASGVELANQYGKISRSIAEYWLRMGV